MTIGLRLGPVTDSSTPRRESEPISGVFERLRRERVLFRYAAWHVLLFMCLFQLGYGPAEWDGLRRAAERTGRSALACALSQDGPLALLKAYYRTDSDERLYREYAKLALEGHADVAYIAAKQYSTFTAPPRAPLVPYRDVRVEYPPLALFLGMVPPRLVSGDSYLGYRFALGAWLCLMQLASLGCALRWLRLSGRDAEVELHLFRASLLFCILLGNIVATRLDGLVALLFLAGLLAIERSLRATGRAALWAASAVGLFAALGVLTKVVPGLLIPTALLVWWSSAREDRTRLVAVALCTGASVLFGLHFLFWQLWGEGYLATFGYHAQRGVQLESTYASLLLFLHWFGLPLELELSFGSSNVASALSPGLAALSPWLWVVATLFVLVRALRARVTEPLPLLTALSLWFIVTSKVFSPQYLSWVALCVFLLSLRERAHKLAWLMLVAAALSQVLYPRAYAALKQFSPPLVTVLCVRNLAVLLLALWVTRLTLSKAQPRTRADSA